MKPPSWQRLLTQLTACEWMLLLALISSAGVPARVMAAPPVAGAVYLTRTGGQDFLTAEFRKPGSGDLSYQVSPDLLMWSAPGINGAPGVVSSVAPGDSQLVIARLDAPVTAHSRYYLRALAPSGRGAHLDFDGDGITDAAVVRDTGLATWIVSLSGGGSRSVEFGDPLSAYFVPADYDGDGKSDFAVWETGAVRQFRILQSSTNTVRTVVFGQQGDNPTVSGDYDGDGKADPAVFRCPSGPGPCGFLYIGSLNNPSGNVTTVPWGSGPLYSSFPYPGDFDGDGRFDFCVQTNSDAGGGAGAFRLKKSAGGNNEVIPFGRNSDLLVPGDYDGDGKWDFAVSRTNGGGQIEWYILERDGGGTGNTPIILGSSGSLRTPGDYDGDGRMDIGVWNPTTGIFSIRKSSDGSQITRTLGTTGDYAPAGWRVQ